MMTLLPTDHESRHARCREWTTALIGQHRDRLGIEPKWVIHTQLLCVEREDHPPQALVEWLPDTYEATISLRCDLPYGILRWETIHELVELSLYRTGTICDHFFQLVRAGGAMEFAELFMSQYRVARNQEVEGIVERYLGETRPLFPDTQEPFFPRGRYRRSHLLLPSPITEGA